MQSFAFMVSIAHNLWSMVYGLLDICWVRAGSMKELWAWGGICKKKKFLKLIPLTIMWVLWKERNRRALDRVENYIVKIKDSWYHYFDSIFLRHVKYR